MAFVQRSFFLRPTRRPPLICPAGDSGGAGSLAAQVGRSTRVTVGRQMTYRRLKYSKGEAFRQAASGVAIHPIGKPPRLTSTKYYGPREKVWLHWECFDAHNAWICREATRRRASTRRAYPLTIRSGGRSRVEVCGSSLVGSMGAEATLATTPRPRAS